MSGIHRLLALPHFPYPGSKVGVLCHHASVDTSQRHLIDHLVERPDWDLRCVFTPEHGFTGKAEPGEEVAHGIHPVYGLPMYSLYGETRSPKLEWLEELDLVVTDLVDLGVRCYTYASTLMEMMRGCTRQGVKLIVLDRTTPLQGIVDGPDLDADCVSFVGQVPLPVVYGKSQGELALYIKNTLPEFRNLDLTILSAVPDQPERWIPPSPAIVSPASAQCYPVTVWSEAIPETWVARGEFDSFQVWAMPDFPDHQFTDGVYFGFEVRNEIFATEKGDWPGFRILPREPKEMRPVTLAHFLLSGLCATLGPSRLFEGKEARPDFFDQLAGTSTWRKSLMSGTSPEFAKTV